MLPLVVGVLAVLAGGCLVWLAWFHHDFHRASNARSGAAAARPSPRIATAPLVDRAGGFRIAVPHGLHGRLDGQAALVASKDRSLLLVVSPSGPGPVRVANAAVVTSMHDSYPRLKVIGHRAERVHGRRGIASFGTATNHAGVRVRWVQLTVEARPRTFTIATYTRHDTDPQWVLPRVNAVVNGFRVLPR